MALRSVIIATAALSAGAVRVTPTTAKAALVAAEPAKVSPPLDPESSKKFFNKDYPHDEQPKTAAQGVKNIGKEVYPKMQETDTFHSDLVKDENGDGGKWETQMAYDIARHKLTKESSEMDKAKAIADAKERRRRRRRPRPRRPRRRPRRRRPRRRRPRRPRPRPRRRPAPRRTARRARCPRRRPR